MTTYYYRTTTDDKYAPESHISALRDLRRDAGCIYVGYSRRTGTSCFRCWRKLKHPELVVLELVETEFRDINLQ